MPIKSLIRTQRLKERQDLLIGVPTDIRALEDGLHELACLEWLKANTPELDGDATARRELRARIAAIMRCIDETLAAIFAPVGKEASACIWFHMGEKLHITSRRAFQENLSRICDALYPATPRLRNELLNRRELSSAAAAARRNLVEAMILHANEPGLKIEGTPPEKSMYLSLLKWSGIHRKSADGWHFGAPSRTGDPGMRAVWSAILDYFRSSEQQAQSVLELYRHLAAPPYGLKAGPMPVLLCAALLANDVQVAHSTKKGHLFPS